MDSLPKIALDRAQFPQQQDFSLRGDAAAIGPVVDRITSFIIAAGTSADTGEEIGLALQEALANAVVHGCGGDASKTVHCAVGCGPAGIAIVVRDPGQGFDPAGTGS